MTGEIVGYRMPTVGTFAREMVNPDSIKLAHIPNKGTYGNRWKYSDMGSKGFHLESMSTA